MVLDRLLPLGLSNNSVFVDAEANVTTIGKLQDQISNTLSKALGPWSIEYKLWRENPASFGAEDQSSGRTSHFLHTLWLSQFPESVTVLTSDTGTVLEGDFDGMLSTKLRSLWIQRQVIRAEGHAYEVHNGDFVLRLANIFLQGSYKGLIVDMEYTREDAAELPEADVVAKINLALKEYGLHYRDTKLARTRIDTGRLYANALHGRYP